MKRPVLATKRQVMSAVINDYEGGRECAAARLGYELKKFDNHIYENAGSRPLNDEQIHLLEQDMGTTYLPEYIAAMYGGMFVPLAKPETLDNVDLYNRSVRAAAKRGVVLVGSGTGPPRLKGALDQDAPLSGADLQHGRRRAAAPGLPQQFRGQGQPPLLGIERHGRLEGQLPLEAGGLGGIHVGRVGNHEP